MLLLYIFVMHEGVIIIHLPVRSHTMEHL